MHVICDVTVVKKADGVVSEMPGDLGDFEVQAGSVEKNRGGVFGALKAHAHMVPNDAKDEAEIQVSVEFLVGW